MPLVDALLPEFDHEMATTRKLLERLPESQFEWKPHVKSMSLGGLATHVATIPYWGEMATRASQARHKTRRRSPGRATRS